MSQVRSARPGAATGASGGARLLAIAMALGIGGCENQLPPPWRDSELVRYSESGKAAFEREDYAEAADLYARALTRAREMDSPRDIIDADIALTLCATEQQDDATGERYLAEAIYEQAAAGGYRGAEARYLGALAMFHQGQAEAAGPIASEVAGDASAPQAIRILAQVLRGRIACQRRESAPADAALAAARALAVKSGPAEQAAIAQLSGEIFQLRGNPVEAAREFDAAARQWQSAGDYRLMAETLTEAAEADVAAKREQPAADRYYRAARALAAHGEGQEARRSLLAAKALRPASPLRELINDALARVGPATAP